MPPSTSGGRGLGRGFYARDAATVARELLGSLLHLTRPDGQVLSASIVETEAYVGEHDLACHASRGKTARTAVMFGPAGHAYVYLVYGLHHMLNVVTGEVGDAQAVLIRAAAPLPPLDGGLNGPGRLTRALSIDMSYNGLDVTNPPLRFTAGASPDEIQVTPRIGVDYAGDWAAAPLRFVDADSPHVSRR